LKADQEIAELQARLLAVDRERQELQKRLAELTLPPSEISHHRSLAQFISPSAKVANTSSVAEKVALFRRLFAGRVDVYPVRWENTAARKSGYAPACANEWRRGICGKPQVKCTECPNQAFVPVSDEMIENHLRGEVRTGSHTAPFRRWCVSATRR
jgi:hypothetical protein